MKRQLMKRRLIWASALGCALMLGAMTTAGAADVTGKWQVKADGGPHGAVEMTLVISSTAENGETLTATLNPGHGDEFPMTGTWTKGALALETKTDPDGNTLILKGALKADGSLSGYMSSPMGDMTWTAARVKL